MLKLADWFVQNWKAIVTILGVIFIISFIKPISQMIRGTKDGFKEILTPLGFIVFLLLIGFAIWLLFFFKGLF